MAQCNVFFMRTTFFMVYERNIDNFLLLLLEGWILELWSVWFVFNDDQCSCMWMKYVKVSGHSLHVFNTEKSVIYERNTDFFSGSYSK